MSREIFKRYQRGNFLHKGWNKLPEEVVDVGKIMIFTKDLESQMIEKLW